MMAMYLEWSLSLTIFIVAEIGARLYLLNRNRFRVEISTDYVGIQISSSLMKYIHNACFLEQQEEKNALLSSIMKCLVYSSIFKCLVKHAQLFRVE